MNQYSENKIKELNAIKLIDNKEWGRFNSRKKMEGRSVYWTWTQKVHIIKYMCPMTTKVWFTENFNGWANDTNALSELYLLPKQETNEKIQTNKS